MTRSGFGIVAPVIVVHGPPLDLSPASQADRCLHWALRFLLPARCPVLLGIRGLPPQGVAAELG